MAEVVQTDQILEKLKNKINEYTVSMFSIVELNEHKFVPITIENGVIYVTVTNLFDTKTASTFIQSKVPNVTIKTAKVNQAQFDTLLKYVASKYLSQVDCPKVKPTANDGEYVCVAGNKLGDLIVAKGLVTQAHLDEAVQLAQKSNKFLGEILVAQKLITPAMLQVVLKEQSNRTAAATQPQKQGQPKKRLGDLLVEKGFLTEEQLQLGLKESKETNNHIGSTLVKLGFITIEQLKEVLGEQQGTEVLSTTSLKIDPSLLKLLPEDFIKENMVIPIRSNGQVLLVGMVEPHNKRVMNDIVYLTGQKIRVMLLTHIEFESCIKNYFSKSVDETNTMMKQMGKEASTLEYEESLFEQVERELQDDSGLVAKFANKIITDAIDIKASDIHIEPRLQGSVVRYRADGILREMFKLPPKTEQSIITRFKVLARMNIAEHRRAQDGTFTLKYGGKDFDFRINTLPVAGKEKMVIRVLAPAVSLNAQDKDIKLAGGTPEDIAIIKKMVAAPNGIILTTGPTGSGKTTTLYSILKSLNDEKVNITTIEDPVEIKIDGINQSQINNKAGITFASSMRAILRQDPDIILIGEIRDYETLETAISAALTGHLVLSTVHTNSAAATISRLIEMGAKEYLVASTVTGIIAQRLVRRLCPLCKEKATPTEEQARSVVLGEENIKKFMQKEVYNPVGCVNCNFSGYSGRLGVYEILPITKEIRKLIAEGVHDLKIEEVAVSVGMKTLHQACFDHILRGETTIEEFIRVLGPVTD